MVAQSDFAHHPSEEILERYALGRVGAPDLEPIEEHLLVCPHCQERLSEADQYVLAMRNAARLLLNEQPRAVPEASSAVLGKKRPALHWGMRWLWPAGAVAFAALALSLAVPKQLPQAGTPDEVALAVSRGAAQDLLTRVAAGRPLRLDIDLTEIPPASSYRLDLVNGEGQLVWSGIGVGVRNQLHFAPSRLLLSGKYWARLYAVSVSPVLVREYGMEAR
jgi:hypothetical protein